MADELKDSSVIMASYDIGGGMQGVIGVVGPTRMDYADLAARLSYFAEGLSRMFGKGEIPPPAQSLSWARRSPRRRTRREATRTQKEDVTSYEQER